MIIAVGSAAKTAQMSGRDILHDRPCDFGIAFVQKHVEAEREIGEFAELDVRLAVRLKQRLSVTAS